MYQVSDENTQLTPHRKKVSYQHATQYLHISLTVAGVDNGQTGVAHRPALGAVHAAGGLHTVGTAMVQDAGGIGQGRAGFGKDRRATGVDVGGRVPHVTICTFWWIGKKWGVSVGSISNVAGLIQLDSMSPMLLIAAWVGL